MHFSGIHLKGGKESMHTEYCWGNCQWNLIKFGTKHLNVCGQIHSTTSIQHNL